MGHLLVGIGHPVFNVNDHDDHIGFFNCDFSLLPDLRQEGLIGHFNPPGGNHRKVFAQPFPVGVEAIPGYSGGVFNDCDPLPGDPVKEGRLPHVRASDNRYYWICHEVSSLQ